MPINWGSGTFVATLFEPAIAVVEWKLSETMSETALAKIQADVSGRYFSVWNNALILLICWSPVSWYSAPKWTPNWRYTRDHSHYPSPAKSKWMKRIWRQTRTIFSNAHFTTINSGLYHTSQNSQSRLVQVLEANQTHGTPREVMITSQLKHLSTFGHSQLTCKNAILLDLSTLFDFSFFAVLSQLLQYGMYLKSIKNLWMYTGGGGGCSLS